MNRKIIFSVGEYYHIYNRGNDKREIFLDDFDRQRFVKLLFLCNGTAPVIMREISKGDTFGFKRGETLLSIGAYCLMPNHFHLLVREKQKNGLTDFFRKIATGYSMYFNLRYQRTGKLFEGVFRAEHAVDDRYLKHLFAYIHLNPIKLIDSRWKENGISNQAATMKYLKGYSFSSLPDYLDVRRPENLILSKGDFPEDFSDSVTVWSELEDWLHTEVTPW